MKTESETETGVMPHKPRSWKKWAGPSPGACEGNMALGHLDLLLPAPEL